MTLSEEDGKLFYRLFMPLLNYVNKKYDLHTQTANRLGMQELHDIAGRMADDVSVIDDFLTRKGQDFSEEHREIIRSWKRLIRGDFLLERHLKKGSIFISLKDNQVYQVHGIMSSWEELYPYQALPILVTTTFMPFRDVIIPNGIMGNRDISFGSNIRRSFKDVYMSAKKEDMIIRSL